MTPSLTEPTLQAGSLIDGPLIDGPLAAESLAADALNDDALNDEPLTTTFTAVTSNALALPLDHRLTEFWPWSWQLAPSGNRTPAYLLAKRAIDIAGALLLLTLLSPVMLATWLVLMVTTKGHPIFAQDRVGFLGRSFRMYKFRTMVMGAAAKQQQVQNDKDGPIFKNFRDPRITRVGRVLRSLSIDETPQLINVLLGQMSLVGPRPALANEVRQYEPWQRQRLQIKPGLTCLWQVSGRSEIGFDEWMRMDVWYLQHQGLWTDLTLLARTPWSVISRRGAY
ncbi:MAG TPA: sugar transferase [Pirellulales bacterium]